MKQILKKNINETIKNMSKSTKLNVTLSVIRKTFYVKFLLKNVKIICNCM